MMDGAIEFDSVLQCCICGDQGNMKFIGGAAYCYNPGDPGELQCYHIEINDMPRHERANYLEHELWTPEPNVIFVDVVAAKRMPIAKGVRYDILRRDRFQCVICGASGYTAQLEIDHIIPVSRGGTNVPENLQTLCFDCNRGKRCKPL